MSICPHCSAEPEIGCLHFKKVHHIHNRDEYAYRERRCSEILGEHLDYLGIHTLAELESRLAPDPRVAELESIQAEAKSIVQSVRYAAPEMRDVLCERAFDLIDMIAAERGEG